jgi:peptidoglycan/xylan/chitin deacetylase (PgdA/CDA1 family)
MRLDRIITLTLGRYFQRTGGGGWKFRLPILMYHHVGEDPEPGVSAYHRTNTTAAMFRRQIGILAEEGYRTMDLSEAAELLGQQRPLAEKSVVITFDDGFRSFYTQAFPVLDDYGFTATMFLPTAFIGTARLSFKNTECLTWDEVRDLKRSGVSFGSHTVNHPKLVDLSLEEIDRELRASKNELEQRLGGRVATFAYPFAFPHGDRAFQRNLKSLLVEAGYACCVTTELGRARLGEDPYRLRRLPVNSLDDAALFRAKLEGGYDWLAWPQAMVKRIRLAVRSFTGKDHFSN